MELSCYNFIPPLFHYSSVTIFPPSSLSTANLSVSNNLFLGVLLLLNPDDDGPLTSGPLLLSALSGAPPEGIINRKKQRFFILFTVFFPHTFWTEKNVVQKFVRLKTAILPQNILDHYLLHQNYYL